MTGEHFLRRLPKLRIIFEEILSHVGNHFSDNFSDVLASLLVWRPEQLTGWSITYSGSACGNIM
jgi:hypothetical protein